jgi:KUP system potassium uptake protein
LLIRHPTLEGNPFFQLAPQQAVVPLVVLATLATIIASQAIITGAFSLTRQAMQLGWFPGMNIRQTSDREYGQIYVDIVNWTMMVCTILLAYSFGSSDRLAGAYGTAVSTTMMLTTILLFSVMRDVWRWATLPAALACGSLLSIDLGFFVANLLKLVDGGWVPLVLAGLVFTIMLTWHRGMEAVRRSSAKQEENAEAFIWHLRDANLARVPGTAVFLSRGAKLLPPLLVSHLRQFKTLPETVISLTVHFKPIPRISEPERVTVEHLTDGLWHATVRFGFVETPNIPMALAQARGLGCPIHTEDILYLGSHDEVVRSPITPRLPAWQRKLFAFMYANAIRARDRFELPPEQSVEIGRQISV